MKRLYDRNENWILSRIDSINNQRIYMHRYTPEERFIPYTPEEYRELPPAQSRLDYYNDKF